MEVAKGNGRCRTEVPLIPIALAVAARVRQERCLVTRAVAANVDIRVCEDDGGGFMVGVHAPGCDEELARCVPAADVPRRWPACSGRWPVADLRTTAEERARLREWRHGDASDARAWRVAEDACHDVDTLLAERESLRSTMGGLIACNDTLLAENAALSAELERLREILAPRGLIELEPTVESPRCASSPSETRLRRAGEARRGRGGGADACSIYPNDAGPQAFATIAKLREAPRRAGGPMSDIDELDRRGCSAPRRDSRRSKGGVPWLT